MITTDSFFQIGTTHEVCEDYAVHGSDHVVVSDGCSNGGGPRIDSDWGSRILCKCSQRFLPVLRRDHDIFATSVGVMAESLIGSLPALPFDALTATLLTLYHEAEDLEREDYYGGVHGLIIGDGVVGGRYRDGRWHIRNFEYLPGGDRKQAAPYYLKYQIAGENNQYWAEFGGKLQVTTYIGNLGPDMEVGTQTYDFYPEKPWQWGEVFYGAERFDFVFAASDGLTSFYEQINSGTTKQTRTIPLIDVLSVLLDIRNFKMPGFLRLQRNWAFKQNRDGTFVRRGWHNGDDVSMGGIYFGD